jgi:cytochrome c-type biogenesis protein CcmE
MADTVQMNWEKSRAAVKPAQKSTRARFAFFGLVVMGAMIAMLISATLASGRYFITVDEVSARTDLVGKTVKVSGAVVGSTIKFDADTQTISFTIAHVPDNIGAIEKAGGLAKALHMAVEDTNLRRMSVVVKNQAMPDLLQNEAQAILTGKLGSDGVFYADELNLKCPSKYQSDVPQQIAN